MLRHRKARAAFTLVELLTVIAVIALLVSMLVPILGRAKSLALRAVCQNNRKFIGEAVQAFASTHGGRGPGHCAGYTHGDPGAQLRGRGWVGYLNVEVLSQKRYWRGSEGTFIQSMGHTPAKGRVYCPSIQYFSNPYPRAHMYNLDASGGYTWGGQSEAGPYGIHVTPPPPPQGDDLVGNPGEWLYYTLGAVLANFPNPGQQFLVVETEAASDYIHARWPAAAPYTIPLGDNGDYPPYCGYSGGFAFRHVLPRDKRLYQTQATANFLFIDGHVQTLTANAKINATDRFNYR